MMTAQAPDQAGPVCWAAEELDYSLVEVREEQEQEQEHGTIIMTMTMTRTKGPKYQRTQTLTRTLTRSRSCSLMQECLTDGLGDVLHAAAGEETAGQEPAVNNVPWANIEGQQSGWRIKSCTSHSANPPNSKGIGSQAVSIIFCFVFGLSIHFIDTSSTLVSFNSSN